MVNEFLIYGSLFVVLLLLIAAGKPRNMLLEIKGFLDTYETIDLSKGGRMSKGYKKWEGDSFLLAGILKLRFGVQFLRWGRTTPLLIRLSIDKEQIPPGLEIQLIRKNTIEAFVPGTKMPLYYPSDTRKECDFLIQFLPIGRFNPEEPVNVSFDIKAEIQTRRWGVFSFYRSISTSYEFVIGPDIGTIWVGIDPGTSGSCIVAGSATAAITIEKDLNAERIMPSVITFNKDHAPEKPYDTLGKVPSNLYKYGDKAASEIKLKRIVAFQSIKKLLGFTTPKVVDFKNGMMLRLDGKELSSLLVSGMFRDFSQFLESNHKDHKDLLSGGLFLPKRAVVAVPNNFTAQKIIDMVECIKKAAPLREVRYITEAEAALCYYIYKHSELHPNSIVGLKDETVLIFDMGGATINTTVADVTRHNDNGQTQYTINIDAKIGYGIGGDTVDYCLAKTIFHYTQSDKADSKKRLVEYFNGTPEAEHLSRIANIQSIVFEIKKLIIQRHESQKYIIEIPRDETTWTTREFRMLLSLAELKDFASKILDKPDLVLDYDHPLVGQFKMEKYGRFPLFDNPFFQELVYTPVADAVREVTKMSEKEGGYINTVIFSGRTCKFPFIRQQVIDVLANIKNAVRPNQKIKPDYITLGENELKTAIAKGACWYGIHKNAIKLSPFKINSTFGVKHTLSGDKKDIAFYELLKIGEMYRSDRYGPYLEGSRLIKDAFLFDGCHVHFYQVMGTRAAEILKEEQKHKYTKLASIPINQQTKEIGILVGANDKVDCTVWTIVDECLNSREQLLEQEITDENEEHYTWLIA